MTEGEGRLIVGRYRLRESLGRGGMGVVWIADDEHLPRKVAIKEIQPHGRQLRATDPEVRRALREARAAAKVGDHAGIVTVLDVATDDHGLPWIVMQLLNGPTLSAVMRQKGTLPIERAARIGMQLLDALDYAHRASVLHRDVKPSNVVLVGDQPVLTDFGIAVIDGESAITEHGQMIGSPPYMAPERFRGEGVHAAADVWSVGVLLYAMVLGRTPFDRGERGATQGAVLNMPPAPDSRLGRLGPVIGGLLHKKPAERMTARQAIAQLAPIAAPPNADRSEPPLPENPDMVPTVTITPEARRPAPPPAPGPVGHGDPTILPGDPVVPARPRGKRGPLVAGVATLVAAVTVVVLVVSLPGDDADGSPSPSIARPTTSMPPLTRVEENDLGFTIDIPEGWEREETSADLAVWTAKQTRPAVGPLRIEVRVSATGSALTRVNELAREVHDNGILDKLLNQGGNPTSAQLEYTYHKPGKRAVYHKLTNVIASDRLYLVAYELWANGDPREHWANSKPLIDKIQASFEPTVGPT